MANTFLKQYLTQLGFSRSEAAIGNPEYRT
jgi:hypothetical protein